MIKIALFLQFFYYQSISAQNPLLEQNYLQWSHEQQSFEGAIRYMAFHNHQLSSQIPYHQHLYYFPFRSAQELFTQYSLRGQYHINTSTLVYLKVPFVINKRKENETVASKQQGLGDVTLIGKYYLYNSDLYQTNQSTKQQLIIGLGLQLPTGDNDRFDELNEQEPHQQTGMGSFAFLGTIDYYLKYHAWQVLLGADYQYNKVNEYNYHFGNVLNVMLQVNYPFQIAKQHFIPTLGLRFIHRKNDLMNGTSIPEDTGGIWYLLSTRLRYQSSKNWGFGLAYEPIITQKLQGIQPRLQQNIRFDIQYLFNKRLPLQQKQLISR